MNNIKNIPNLKLEASKSKIYSDVDGLSLQNLFYCNNNYFPNCYMFTNSERKVNYHFDAIEMAKYLEENTPADEHLEMIKYVTEDLSTKEYKIGFCIILHKSNIYARIENSVTESYVLFSNDNIEALNSFKEIIYKFYVKPEEEKNNLYKVSQDQTGFHLNKGKIKEVEDFDIKLQYNDDFKHEDVKIRNFIATNDKSGLILLHGDKGTGKTTYIRNLITTNIDKKFVFISPDLINLFGQPSFTTFLNGLENHIIILEDCENIIRDRKTTGHVSAVSTLLNMSDGLLADDLGIKFICTFNEDIKDIDSALMRKGRLISKYEFKPLALEKTNNLLINLYGDNVIKSQKPMTLADIYNYEEDSYEIIRKPII